MKFNDISSTLADSQKHWWICIEGKTNLIALHSCLIAPKKFLLKQNSFDQIMKKCTIIRLSLKLLPPKYQTNKGLIKCWSFAKTCTTKLLAWQRKNFVIWEKLILTTLQVPTPQYGQTHSNNSSPTADELFECLNFLYPLETW